MVVDADSVCARGFPGSVINREGFWDYQGFQIAADTWALGSVV